MNKPKRARNLTAEERRNVTVEAVIELAASTNPGEITTAAVAEQMGVTEGAVFRHFPNKEAIWKAVMAWVAEHLMDRLDRSTEDIASPVEAMQAMFLAHIGFVADHPGAPRMLYGELQGPKKTPAKRLAETMMKDYAARLRQLIELGKARGELLSTLDDEAAVKLFIGTIQGLVMQGLMSGDMAKTRADAPRLFAIYRRGIDFPGADRKG